MSSLNSYDALVRAFGNIASRPTEVSGEFESIPRKVNFCGGPPTDGEDLTAEFIDAPRLRTNGAKFCFMFPGIWRKFIPPQQPISLLPAALGC